MRRLGDAYRAFDRYQQRHGLLGFPLAVLQKYGDDQGGYLAATLSRTILGSSSRSSTPRWRNFP